MSTLPYRLIPYGWADFRAIRLEDRLYVDKTRFIRPLENERFTFLIRPRRFGKSCWVSLLENYYDRKWADELPLSTKVRVTFHGSMMVCYESHGGLREPEDSGR